MEWALHALHVQKLLSLDENRDGVLNIATALDRILIYLKYVLLESISF